jgi:hypothetical protein
MANIDGVKAVSRTEVPSPSGSASSGSGELAKCESQLSDWVNCPSSKTSAGKAKIAEITGKIQTIKAQMKKAEDAKAVPAAQTHAVPVPLAQALRFDGIGSWLDMHA